MKNKKRDWPRLRRTMETAATAGLLLVAVGTLGPVFTFRDTLWPVVFKWIYAVGALVYTGARIAGSLGRDESVRVRRLRRMEFWAGLAFCFGAFFWFYNQNRFQDFFSLQVVRETIVFTMVGAVIQIIASWRLSKALRRELKDPKEE